jgi:acetylornithine deacetylase/succinyl-diaminopimelate desuccinylase-like protein
MTDPRRSEYFLRRLVSVPSVSGNEEACVDVCLALMNEIGLKTKRVECDQDPGAVNVEGIFGNKPPVLCLTGHIDTIPFTDMTVNPLGEERNGRFYGRGASDMKGGLAAILAAVERVIKNAPPPRGTILVVATAREETIKSGGYQLAHDHRDVDGIVCAEPTDCRIAIAATGSLPLRLDVHGKPGHSSHSGSGINAIRATLGVVDALYQEFGDTVTVPYVGERQRGFNAGVIRGGMAQPVVAESCSVWLDVRVFPGETNTRLLERADAVRQRFERSIPGLRLKVTPDRLDYQGNSYPLGSLAYHIHVDRGMKPLLTTPGTPLVKTFVEALRSEGGDAALTMMSGWGDIEFLATDHGVPAIYFGPGDIKAAHTRDESIDFHKYHLAISVFERAITTFLRADSGIEPD